MKKFVVYNGGTETNVLVSTTPVGLVKGKRYEVVAQTVYADENTYTLKDVVGEFDAKWFDEEKIENKPVYFAKAVIYKNISRFIGGRVNLMKLVKDKYKMIMTEPIIGVEPVYGCVHKIETEKEVYITYTVERTVG